MKRTRSTRSLRGTRSEPQRFDAIDAISSRRRVDGVEGDAMIQQRNLRLRKVEKQTRSHGPFTSFSWPSSVARISHASSWRDRRQTQHVASKDVAANNVPQGAQATRRTVLS